MSNKFLYEVRPVKPVVTPDGRSMRRPFSSLLSKEEVTAYMKAANIYRRFPDITEPIKVTGATLDELHREKFNVTVMEAPVEESPEGEITGEEIIDTPENPEKGIEEVVEETPVEEPVVKDVQEEEVIEPESEEVVEESSVIEEEVIEEPAITEEVQEEDITETVTEEPVEEVVESVEEKVEEVVEETPVEEHVVEDVQEDQNEVPAPVVTEEVVTASQETSAPVAPKAATIQMNHGYHNNKKKHHH